MTLTRHGATFGLLALALSLCACGFGAGDPNAASFARTLGPVEAPVRLYVREQGEGPPLLLIHGFGTSSFTWRRVVPELARDHRVIAVDLKGFGQSDKPFDERYSASDQAELLAQLIENRDLHDVTLVGHSFGGGVALMLALEADTRLKGRISRLVLINSIAYAQKIPTFFKLLNMPVMSQLGVRMAPPSWQIEVALKIAYYDDSKIDPAEVEAYSEPLSTAAGKHAIIYSARQIVPDDLEQISARYKSITLPTLILWCDHDRIVPLDIGLKLRRAMPNSTFKLVSECGHMPQEEQPAVTVSLIRGFLDDQAKR